ncbi:MAG: DapH/DapD/GlmU-related protein [Flavobacteriales bacterium]
MKFNNINVTISKNAKIGHNVLIGDNTTIYDNVVINDNVIIANNCIIGEPNNKYYEDVSNYINPTTIIGKNSLIRSHCIIYSGSKFDENFSTGHRVTIRENSIFGHNCRVGTLSDIQDNVSFGDFCSLHSNVHIGQSSTIGSHVFIYPYVVFTNDPTPPSIVCKGPTMGDFSIIAVGSIILPNVKIGNHCLIGANSVVGIDIEDYQLAIGNPAKPIKDVRDFKNKEGYMHYPWPYNFERGMAWEKIGFEKWKLDNGYEND